MFTIQYGDRKIRPGKIICVGRNYADHARELNNALPTEPVFFMKPASAITDQPRVDEHPARFEAELTFLVEGTRLVAVALGLDLTRGVAQQELKSRGLPWERAKAFRGSALFSPFVPVESWTNLGLAMNVNGARRQTGGVADMIFAPDVLLKEIDVCFGLEDGDLIMTGTPAGVGDLVVGDRLTGQVLQDETVLLNIEWSVAAAKNF